MLASLAMLLRGKYISPFTPPTTTALRGRVCPVETNNPHKMLTTDWNSFWTAVEVFDGSDIVDSVVVSNVFWTSLQTKFVSFMIGQFLAAAAFSILLSVVSFQFTKVTDFVSEKIFPSSTESQEPKRFEVPRNLRDGDDDNKSQVVRPDFVKLLVCLAIDVIGTSSEVVPILGEVSDVVWAPIAGLILRSLYGSNILFALEFTEEILPFTDILPLATLCWVIDTFFRDSDLAKLLRLGQYGSTVKTSDRPSAIEVDSETISRNVRKLVGDTTPDTKDR
jgi:hypothetical protein